MTKTQNDIYNTLIFRELLPPPIAQCKINGSLSDLANPTLLHRSMTYCGRAFDVRRNCFRSAELKRASLCSHLTAAFLCLCLIVSAFFLGSCQQEEVRTTGMQQLYQESQHLNQAGLDSIDSFTTKLGDYINAHPSVLEDELYEPLINNINLSLAPYGYCVKVTTVSVGVKVETDWKGEKFINF